MTTTEHLSRIRARCVELLAIAEKRTAGWSVEHGAVKDPMAEAGWRSTIAAIDGLQAIAESSVSADPCEACDHPSDALAALQSIIAAWPEELL